LTTFTDGANVSGQNETEIPMEKINLLSNPYPKQPLKQILSRKFRVATVNITTATPVGSVSWVEFPGALFTVPSIAEKLKSFKYFRGGVRFEVRINSTPMHVGALQVSYLPYQEAGSLHGQHHIQRSGNSSSIISASLGNSVNGLIPWVNPRLGLWTGSYLRGEIGCLWIDLLVALDGTGSSVPDVTVSVFASFDDPEVWGYSPPQLVAPALEEPKAQGKTALSEEAQQAEKAESQSVVGKVVNTVRSVVKSVETVGSELNSVAGEVMGFANLMGLCKPDTEKPITTVFNNPYANVVHTEGVDLSTAISAGFDAKLDNKVEVCGKDGPSMTILKLAMKPMIIGTFKFNHATAVEDVITNIDVHPMLVWGDGGLPEKIYPSYLAYVAQFFQYWRGTIKYRLHFITSAFISARIRISHNMTGGALVNVEDYGGDIPSVVLDIKGDTIFDFSVPFTKAVGYMPVNGMQSFLGGVSSFYNSAITITLVNEVVGPNGVGDQTVNCLIYAAAGEDMRFVRYRAASPGSWAPTYLPPLNVKERAEIERERKNRTKTTKNSPLRKKNLREPRAEGLNEDFSVPFEGLVPCKQVIEEKMISAETFTTVKELCHRYSEHTFKTDDGIADQFDVTPMHFLGEKTPNFYLWSQVFLFWRGSIRYAFLGGTYKNDVQFLHNQSGVSEDLVSDGLLPTLNGWVFSSVPWYTPYVMLPTLGDGSTPFNFYITAPGARADEELYVYEGTLEATFEKCMYAAGDDFDFIYSVAPKAYDSTI
jgi:hypothetical protein